MADEKKIISTPDKEKQGAVSENKLKLFLTALSSREKALLASTGVVLALVLIDVIVIHPTNDYLKKLDVMIADRERRISQCLQVLKHQNKILAERKEQELFIVSPALSQEEEIARFLREIEKVSKEVNLFVFNINPVKVNKKSEEVYELTVDLEGKGGISQIRQFISILETKNPDMRVDAFNLKPQGKETQDLKYVFTIAKIGIRQDKIVYGKK